MKNILLILLSCTLAFADDVSLEKKIYESFFDALSTEKTPKVYVDSKKESLSLSSNTFTLVNSCKEADIVVMTQSDLPEVCQSKIVFGTRYHHLKNDFVVGAFFWQKGRPNIVFIEDRLIVKKITLPESLQDYLE